MTNHWPAVARALASELRTIVFVVAGVYLLEHGHSTAGAICIAAAFLF
jgi:hypothetical protein